MSALIRAHDWAATPLGPLECWPQSLRTAVDIVLACAFPMIVLWGPALVQVYNDGYRALMGVKHPAGLGQPTRACWPEVWHINVPIYERVWAGETLTFEDTLYPITRYGDLEDAWFTLCYNPLRDDTNAVAGVLVTVFETTERVLAARQRDAAALELRARTARQAFLVRLGDALRSLPDAGDIQRAACRVLGEHLHAHRVQYAEIIDGTEVLISHEYLNGLLSIRGHQPVDTYGAEVVAAFRRGEPLIIDDVATDPRVPAAARGAFAAAGVTSTLATSLIKGGRWVATLAVDMRTPRHWTTADIALLQETAERTWDAVERARAEAALRASEARLRRALEIETVGVIFFKTTGEITHANEAFLRMSGYTAADQERVLVRWDAMTPPEYMPASRNAVQEFTRCGRTTPYEKEYIRKDGSRWWALFAATRIDEATGVEYIVDITERKRAEAALRETHATLERRVVERTEELAATVEQLRESEERFRTLVQASSEVLYVMSPDWSEMRALSGGGFLADTQRPSRTWLEHYIHPDDQPQVMDAIQEAVRTKSVFALEHRVRRADGSLGWTLSRAVPRLGPDGAILEWFGAASDVTARKEAEEALRTALAEQRALLREVNHRVKNNLEVVNSLLSLQAADVDDARAQQALTEAANRVRALGVVHRLLYDAPSPAQVDLGCFASELAQALFASYGVAAERVRFVLSGERLGTDLEQAVPLGLILNELVSNALKYAFPGERAGRIHLRIDANGRVLELADDGVGLPASVDVEHPRTLGLQLVQALGRQVGGTLQVLPGPGTRYRLQLSPAQEGGSSLARRSSAS